MIFMYLEKPPKSTPLEGAGALGLVACRHFAQNVFFFFKVNSKCLQRCPKRFTPPKAERTAAETSTRPMSSERQPLKQQEHELFISFYCGFAIKCKKKWLESCILPKIMAEKILQLCF